MSPSPAPAPRDPRPPGSEPRAVQAGETPPPPRGPRKRNTLARAWAVLKACKPILLSHHPECDHYAEHTLRVRGARLCIGCFVSFPTAVGAFFLFYYAGLFALLDTRGHFLVGLAFTAVHLLSFTRYLKKRRGKVLKAFLVGIGMAFLVASVWFSTLPPGLKPVVVLVLWQVYFVVLNLLRGWQMVKECRHCEWAADWDRCPGMRRLMAGLRAANAYAPGPRVGIEKNPDPALDHSRQPEDHDEHPGRP